MWFGNFIDSFVLYTIGEELFHLLFDRPIDPSARAIFYYRRGQGNDTLLLCFPDDAKDRNFYLFVSFSSLQSCFHQNTSNSRKKAMLLAMANARASAESKVDARESRWNLCFFFSFFFFRSPDFIADGNVKISSVSVSNGITGSAIGDRERERENGGESYVKISRRTEIMARAHREHTRIHSLNLTYVYIALA